GTPITIRHLVHHTSGLRDQWTLWAMAGGRLDDVITQQDLLRLIQRQRELNFPPGSEHLYSNTGYMLLAEIVARVSREPFGVWMKRNVFDPLGMKHTQIYDDHERLVKGRADSYRRNQNGWSKSVLSYANSGATSLFTTVGDLALWLDNFRTAKVGGPAVVAHMKQRGVLTKGDTIDYAFGIGHGKHRGLSMLAHSGGDAGFRTYVAYLPELEAGVIAVGNDATFNPGQVSRDVAEAFFGDRMTPPEDPTSPPTPSRAQPTPWKPSVQELEKYVGVYYSPELETRYQVVLHNNALVARHRRNGDITLNPDSADKFRASSWYFSNVDFERDAQGKVVAMRVSSGRVRGVRFERIEK
ncbi:MAG TPA: serine hydrolase domain-containing protein, partial [Longimicrobiales bacterium]